MKHSSDTATIDKLWSELELHYGEVGRFYHTLNHISGIIAVLENALSCATCADALLFAAFYHDVIYNVQSSDNEEKSAELASARLAILKVPEEITEQCRLHILATRTHAPGGNPDTDIFTDADLAILGGTRPLYLEYCKNIRKEYAFYSDAEYARGRKRVLERFLAMDSIFKTNFFRERYEQQARKNIEAELAELEC